MWISRAIKGKLDDSSKTRPVTLLTGARQTGKSSLCKKLFPDAHYVTFDHINQLESAKDSPGAFLDSFQGQVILDEIQYLPSLFTEIKIRVDNDRDNYGKWLLTGSQQFELMKGIGETLAGRINILHLETLSAHELRESKIESISDFLWRGGYPEIWKNQSIDLDGYFQSYLRTYIERDLRSIIEVKNLNDFQRFLKVLATRAGQLLNSKDISKDIGVADVTVKKWISALEISGIVYLLPPYFANIGKRLVKSPKIYFADHGLLCHLLGIENSTDWNTHIYKGHLWENFVMMELIKTNLLRPGRDLFFYRDQNGVEIDFVVEKKSKLYFIEAKAGEKIDSKKLNFDKVIPLFKKQQTEAILAQNIEESSLLKMKNFRVFNPLKIDIEL